MTELPRDFAPPKKKFQGTRLSRDDDKLVRQILIKLENSRILLIFRLEPQVLLHSIIIYLPITRGKSASHPRPLDQAQQLPSPASQDLVCAPHCFTITASFQRRKG
jgi:hypothetical protein